MAEMQLFQCGICREGFTRPEYAARCQAQGVPPLLFYCYDVLALPRLANRAPRRELLVVHSHRVHHAIGVKCPVNGPCQHDLSYTTYRIQPRWLGRQRAWVAPPDENQPRGRPDRWYQGTLAHLKRYQRVATLSDAWGVLLEEADPVRVLAGPDPFEEWIALWELHDRLAPRARPRRRSQRRPQLALQGEMEVFDGG